MKKIFSMIFLIFLIVLVTFAINPFWNNKYNQASSLIKRHLEYTITEPIYTQNEGESISNDDTSNNEIQEKPSGFMKSNGLAYNFKFILVSNGPSIKRINDHLVYNKHDYAKWIIDNYGYYTSEENYQHEIFTKEEFLKLTPFGQELFSVLLFRLFEEIPQSEENNKNKSESKAANDSSEFIFFFDSTDFKSIITSL